jgi:protein O-mannosyl-transferase
VKQEAVIEAAGGGSPGERPRFWAGRAVGAHHIVLAAALLLTAVAYCGTLKFEFVYDDRAQVIENPWIHSWQFVPRYFTVHVWGLRNPNQLGNYYRPIFLFWLRINYWLFGLNPWGWHLSSVLLHLAVTLLVYFLAVKFSTDRLTAAVAALIFGLHPVHLESVAWVSGVTEPLMAAFLVSAFLSYLKYRERRKWSLAWLVISLCLFAAATLSKETALILPILILAYEWVSSGGVGDAERTRARSFRSLRLVLPYLAVVPFYLAARSVALKGISHVMTPLPNSTIVFTWPSVLWFYVKLLVWPAKLSVCYDSPYVTRPSFLDFWMPSLGLAAVAFLAWAWAGRGSRSDPPEPGESRAKTVALASVWLILPVVPLLNLRYLPLGESAHDRYLYLPSVGFAIIAAVIFRSLQIGRVKLLGQPALQVASAAIITMALTVSTVVQSLVWADDLLLFKHALDEAPNNRIMKMNLAIVACERGLNQAGIKLYKEVVQQNPVYWPVYYQLGLVYYKLGNLEEADKWFSQAVEINLLYANSFLYLGLTRLKMGRPNEAVPFLRHAIEVSQEGSPVYHFALGCLLRTQGDLKGALEEFKQELAVDPEQNSVKEQIAEIEKLLSNSRPELTPVSKASSHVPAPGAQNATQGKPKAQ